MSDAQFFADDPVDGTASAPDLLGRGDYADHIVRLLDRVRSHSESSVLALIGAWGSGKSSVLNMVARKLETYSPSSTTPEEEPRWLVATFNPWTYGDVESLQMGFFRELRSILPTDARWSEARKKIGDFGRSIAPLAGLIPGIDAESAVKAMGDTIAGDQSATSIKAAAEGALRDFGRPILFIMDDLDRLTPEELLLVFKLVRLVGRLPHVYYLLSYDEATLLDVLSRTDLVPLEAAADKRRARDYLEKIIQVRLDLPILRDAQALGMIDDCLSRVTTTNAVAIDDMNFDRFRRAFHDHIRRRLATPRAINRYFTQVEALFVQLGEEIDFVDFLLLTWIRTAEPELYSKLLGHKGKLTGSGLEGLFAASVKQSHQEAREGWAVLLRESGVAEKNVDGVLAILAQMFLPIRSARDGSEYVNGELDSIRARRGVGHVDYFDRYFSFGVPAEDIADSTVRQAMVDLAAGETSAATDELRSKILSDTARVCRKLGSEREQGNVPAGPVLVFLADLYHNLPAPADIFLDPRRSVQFLATDLLPDVSAQDGPSLLRRMADAPDGVPFLATIVASARHGSSSEAGRRAIEWLDVAEELAAELAMEFFSACTTTLESLGDEQWRAIWAWRWLDHEQMREWLRAATLSKPGWTVEDVVAMLVQRARVGGGGFSALELPELESLLGVDFALSHLPPLDEEQRLNPSWGLAPTWENRIRLARTALDEERRRRAAEDAAKPDAGPPPQLDNLHGDQTG